MESYPPLWNAASTFDYETWTGPTPMRPYNPLVHLRTWRALLEYGNGIIEDMCIHMLAKVRWMMDLGWATSVTSATRKTATFDYPEVKVI